jgi:hypothetical protein
MPWPKAMSASAILLLIFATDEDSRLGSGSGEAGMSFGADLPSSGFEVCLGICTLVRTRFKPPDAKSDEQNPSSTFVERSIRNIMYESSTPRPGLSSVSCAPCSPAS